MIYTARQLTPASPSLKSGGGGGRVLTAAAGEARELAAGAASDGRDALRSLSECVGRQARRRADAQGACVQATTHARGSYTHDRTRFSIQTAGLAFGGTGLYSYRVRGVGGSYAEHLTVES